MVEEHCRVPTGGQADGGLSNAPMHIADMGTDAFQQEMSSALLENEQYLLEEAVAALRRLDTGAYGECETCGRQIAPERLDAIPYTRYCVKCAAGSNTAPTVNVNNGRPSEETVTVARTEEPSIERSQSGS